MITSCFSTSNNCSKNLPYFVKFPPAILFKFFPKIFIAYFFGRVIGRQQLHDTIKARAERNKQIDEKVVEDVDRMTTTRSHNYPKMISNVRFVTVIYVLEFCLFLFATQVCHRILFSPKFCIFYNTLSLVLFYLKLKSNLALQVHLQVLSLRLLTEFFPIFMVVHCKLSGACMTDHQQK